MTIQLNPKGNANARQLIADGKVDRDSAWSMSADDENEILGNDDWIEYGKWFLGIDETQNAETKAHFRYPIGKSGKVYRSAIIAIRQRSGQQDDAGIFDAAGELINLIDGKSDESGASIDMNRLKIAASPWALMPECIAVVASPLAATNLTARPARARPSSASSGSIAVLSLSGVITQHPDFMGDSNLDEFMGDFMSAMNDPTVGALLISIDSPGGSVYGAQEASDMMIAMRGKKPVVAFANSLAASAAYWLGCCASEFYCTPSGEVGSIGVWQAHMDISAMLQNAGIKTTIISAGKYKIEGNPYQPLDDDAQQFMQSRVDDYYNAFVACVASARNVSVDYVKTNMGQGRVLGAQDALKNKMIDGILTMPQVIQKMANQLSATTQLPSKKAATSIRSRLSIMV